MTVMDLYSSRISLLEKKNEVPLHCSPAYDSDDVLCAGSDNEETINEVREKRTRYEDEARRYLEGYIPILQSAALKGPLDSDSGWVNPWRHQALKRIRPDQEGAVDRREPEFETNGREYVVERTTEKSLGYLTPAEALEWCKHSIYTERATAAGMAESTEPSKSTKQTERFVGQDLHNITALKERLGPQSGCLDCSASSNSQVFGDTGEKQPQPTTTKYTKRPADSSWLKGSYQSKRARYDSPSIPSPSPLLKVMEGKCHRTTTRIGSTTSNVATESEGVISSSKPSKGESKTLLEATVTTENRPEGQNRHMSRDEPSILCPGEWSLDFESSKKKPRTPMEIGVLCPKDHGESISAISFRYSSSPSSHIRPSECVDLPVPHMRRRVLSNEAESPDQQQRLPVFDPNSNSKQHRRPYHNTAVDDFDLTNEISFVTEIAPSSRDLEKFQYRVKMRLINSRSRENSSGQDQSRDETSFKSNTPRSIVDRPLGSRPASGETENEWDTTVEGPKSSRVTNNSPSSAERSVSPVQEIRPASHSPDRTTMRLGDITRLPEGEDSDNDWDAVDDIVRNPSYVDAVTRPATGSKACVSPSSKGQDKLSTPTSGSLQSQSNNSLANLEEPTRETNPCFFTSSSRSESHTPLSIFRHLQVQSLEQDSKQVTSEEQTTTTENMVVNQDDISTQSKITTQTSSMKSPREAAPIYQMQPEDTPSQHVKMGTGNRSLFPEMELDMENAGIEDEMEAIQSVLSQTCSGLDSGEKRQTRFYRHHSGQIHVDDVPGPDGSIREYHVKDATNESIENLQSVQKISHEGSEQDHARGMANTDQGETPVQNLGAFSNNDNSGIPLSSKESEAGKPIAPPLAEESWNGCGSQSPWTAEPTEVVTRIVSKGLIPRSQEALKTPSEPTSRELGQNEALRLSGSNNSEKSSGTPRLACTTARKEPTTPMHLLHNFLGREGNSITSTQMVVEAATKNPWDSSLKSFNCSKSKKRVSFRDGLSDEKENLQIHEAGRSPSYQHIRTSPSFLTSFEQHQSVMQRNEQVTMIEKPEEHPISHFRTLRRILPDQSASQMHSSPAAISAMAEAFISADRDMASPLSYERRSILSRSPIRRHKTLSATHDNNSKVNKQENGWSADSVSRQGDNCTTTDFDMQAALGEMGDFLEDWSVEAELKKARVAGSKGGVSSDAERRSLFGMV